MSDLLRNLASFFTRKTFVMCIDESNDAFKLALS